MATFAILPHVIEYGGPHTYTDNYILYWKNMVCHIVKCAPKVCLSSY